MPMAIIFLQLGDDTADCKAGSISFYPYLKSWVKMLKQQGFYECCLEVLKHFSYFWWELEFFV